MNEIFNKYCKNCCLVWPPTLLLEKPSLTCVCRKYGKTSYKTRYTRTNICNVALNILFHFVENKEFEVVFRF